MDSMTSTPQPTLSHELRVLINQRNILTATSKAKVLNALDQQIEESKSLRQIDLRSKVIEEIFTSELSYLNQLELIIKYFKEPLDSSKLISPSTHRILFNNIESLYKVNGELVNQLRIQGNNIGAAFVHLAPFFKLYSMYAYDYKNALNLLEDLSKQNSKLSVWIKKQESRPEVSNKLSALMIAPIQRLPRYRLLLRQLLSLTHAIHPHHAVLAEAVKAVEKSTTHIDSLVFKQETHSRLVTLQHCLVNSRPSIVAPDRRLLKEGILMKMSANGQKAQKRYFILLSDSIVYCKLLCREGDRPPQEPGSLQCCCVLPISKCSVESVLGQGVFKLTCRSETYILFSEYKDDAMEWVEEIKNAESQYQENLRTLRKKSSSRHPLHLTRKRKYVKENAETKEDDRPAKKSKTCHLNQQDKENKTQETEEVSMPRSHQREDKIANYVQSMKSLLRTFGESVRQYLYPGSSSR